MYAKLCAVALLGTPAMVAAKSTIPTTDVCARSLIVEMAHDSYVAGPGRRGVNIPTAASLNFHDLMGRPRVRLDVEQLRMLLYYRLLLMEWALFIYI